MKDTLADVLIVAVVIITVVLIAVIKYQMYISYFKGMNLIR